MYKRGLSWVMGFLVGLGDVKGGLDGVKGGLGKVKEDLA